MRKTFKFMGFDYNSSSDFLEEISRIEKSAACELRKISKVIHDELEISTGPKAIFYHQSAILTRMSQLVIILKRMHVNNFELNKCEVKLEMLLGRRNFPTDDPRLNGEIRRVLKSDNVLWRELELDCEALHIFGSILLDQWAIFFAYLANLKSPQSYAFGKVVESIEKKGANILLSQLQKNLSPVIIFLHYRIGIKRHKFIVHEDQPYQKGSSRTALGDDFRINYYSPPGWLDEAAHKDRIYNYVSMLPEGERNKMAGKDYRKILQYIFANIWLINDPKIRKEIAEIYEIFGGSSLDYKEIGFSLLNFIEESNTSVLSDVTQSSNFLARP